MDYEYVSMTDLKVGDIVLAHGMRLLIDQEPHQTRHRLDGNGPTVATAALVLNWEETQEKGDRLLVHFIRSDMAPESHRTRNGLEPYTEPRWTLQGNKLAQVARVLRETDQV